jgi:hypothetical protein
MQAVVNDTIHMWGNMYQRTNLDTVGTCWTVSRAAKFSLATTITVGIGDVSRRAGYLTDLRLGRA